MVEWYSLIIIRHWPQSRWLIWRCWHPPLRSNYSWIVSVILKVLQIKDSLISRTFKMTVSMWSWRIPFNANDPNYFCLNWMGFFMTTEVAQVSGIVEFIQIQEIPKNIWNTLRNLLILRRARSVKEKNNFRIHRCDLKYFHKTILHSG